MKEFRHRRWKNKINQHEVFPYKFLLPEHLRDIQEAVREAEQEGFRIRAVGAGHSYSDVAMPDGFLLDMRYLDKMDILETDQAEVEGNSLVEVEAGIPIHKLNRMLDKKKLALINMGAIDNQTISGAIATGTHGAGRNLKSLPAMVRSILLVAAEGKTYRIEPSQGITLAARHHEEEITLIQDNEVFYSTLVSMGYTGIVHSYIIEVRPRYWLYENRAVMQWSELKQQLMDGSIFDDYPIKMEGRLVRKSIRSLFIVINPYEIEGNHSCMIARTFEVDKPRQRKLRDRTRNLLSLILGSIPITYYLTLLIVNYLPRLIPASLNQSIRLVRDQTYVDKSYKVLFQGLEFIASQGHGAEFAYDMHQPAEYIQVIEAIFAKVKELVTHVDVYPSSAPTIRFVQASKAYISPEYQMDVCYIGNPALVKQRKSRLILNAYQDLNLKMGGKPHWGKIINRLDGHPELIRKWYPKFDNWQKVMLRFNPIGTFLNGFADRLRLAMPKGELQSNESNRAAES
ncbi:FAD-binding protein [Catalinimonas niigatensis]|uniref:FAD-binding protein n=1 Tax=Catalinimonas niigatensis TaxID=1397264 RepID=UPI002664E6BE|nr:FAD-binding protein [Catalinimonas niigatensis]WPP52881.1 FAD-binding protein [Catalinimonas niigatensis]